MYRLMKSEKFTFEHAVSGSMSSYRQILVNKFRQFSTALTACEVANDIAGFRHYVLNESGEEYYEGTWID
jgi:hypothetical protein